MSLNTVPADILLEIADYLSCSAEVLHLYLTVRANLLLRAPRFPLKTFMIVITNRRCAHLSPLFAHRPAWPCAMRAHARYALHST